MGVSSLVLGHLQVVLQLHSGQTQEQHRALRGPCEGFLGGARVPRGHTKVTYEQTSKTLGLILTVIMVDVVSCPANMNVLTLFC